MLYHFEREGVTKEINLPWVYSAEQHHQCCGFSALLLSLLIGKCTCLLPRYFGRLSLKLWTSLLSLGQKWRFFTRLHVPSRLPVVRFGFVKELCVVGFCHKGSVLCQGFQVYESSNLAFTAGKYWPNLILMFQTDFKLWVLSNWHKSVET